MMPAETKRDIITVWMEINRAEIHWAERVLGADLLLAFQDEIEREVARFGAKLGTILIKYERRQDRILKAGVVRIDNA